LRSAGWPEPEQHRHSSTRLPEPSHEKQVPQELIGLMTEAAGVAGSQGWGCSSAAAMECRTFTGQPLLRMNRTLSFMC